MPRPPSIAIKLTAKQAELLQRLCRRPSSPQQQVRRAAIILKVSEGLSNQQVAELLEVHRITVRQWRERWLASTEALAEIEEQGEDKAVLAAIEKVLSDAYRSGTPASFSAEQVVQIVALACEAPTLSERPISHWTPKELADEAVKRGIVKTISAQSVERFLKGSGYKAASVTLLADQ